MQVGEEVVLTAHDGAARFGQVEIVFPPNPAIDGEERVFVSSGDEVFLRLSCEVTPVEDLYCRGCGADVSERHHGANLCDECRKEALI